MTRRRWVWGAVLAALHVLVAMVSYRAGLLPTRPVYDGLAPPSPYRWVEPPPGLSSASGKPDAAKGTVAMTEGGSEPHLLSTGDGQFTAVFVAGAFPPGTSPEIRLTVEPLDPTTLAPPPDGLAFDSNAYRIRASPLQEPARLDQPATVLLRYARAADELLILQGDRWVVHDARLLHSSLQLSAEPSTLGTFVAAGDAESLDATHGRRATPAWVWVTALAAVVFALGSGWQHFERRRRARDVSAIRKRRAARRPR